MPNNDTPKGSKRPGSEDDKNSGRVPYSHGPKRPNASMFWQKMGFRCVAAYRYFVKHDRFPKYCDEYQSFVKKPEDAEWLDESKFSPSSPKGTESGPSQAQSKDQSLPSAIAPSAGQLSKRPASKAKDVGCSTSKPVLSGTQKSGQARIEKSGASKGPAGKNKQNAQAQRIAGQMERAEAQEVIPRGQALQSQLTRTRQASGVISLEEHERKVKSVREEEAKKIKAMQECEDRVRAAEQERADKIRKEDLERFDRIRKEDQERAERIRREDQERAERQQMALLGLIEAERQRHQQMADQQHRVNHTFAQAYSNQSQAFAEQQRGMGLAVVNQQENMGLAVANQQAQLQTPASQRSPQPQESQSRLAIEWYRPTPQESGSPRAIEWHPSLSVFHRLSLGGPAAAIGNWRSMLPQPLRDFPEASEPESSGGPDYNSAQQRGEDEELGFERMALVETADQETGVGGDIETAENEETEM